MNSSYLHRKRFQRTRPGIMVAAMKGGAGKTIATLGIIRALYSSGTGVVPLKKGPDYIDARWLAMAAGHTCYNLDPYLMSREVIQASYAKREEEGEICVMEGNRGLHDGVDIHGSCSTAELAKWLDLPVILVVDCTKVTRTAAALVSGCASMDPEVKIAGVVLNQVVRPRHEDIITRSIEHYTDIPVTGAIPRMKKDPLPMRHLGLTPADEHETVVPLLDSLGQTIKANVDIERIKKIASDGTLHKAADEKMAKSHNPVLKKLTSQSARPCVAIIRDAAFQFYYPENIEALEQAGARIIFLDSLSDTCIPDEVDALYIGGGFPETQADKLAANSDFRNSLKQRALSGLPVYAECGGLMYLGRHIIWKDNRWPMTGIIDWDFRVQSRPAGHGYTILEVTADTAFYTRGTLLKGHEFHYSVPERCTPPDELQEVTFTCRVKRGHGFTDGSEGVSLKNIFATYTHIHALGHTGWGDNIVNAAHNYMMLKNNE